MGHARNTLFGALAFVAVAAVAPFLPPWLVSLATIAFANALVVLGLDHPVAHRPGAVRAGAVLRDRRLCRGAARPLHAGSRRVRGGVRRRGCRRHRGLPDRLPAGALSRNLLRHAQPRDVDDPLRRAGEDRDARLDRRLPRRGRHVPRLAAAGRDAQPRAVLARARRSRRSRRSWWRAISARWRERWRTRCATTRSASSSSASRSTG